MALVRISACLFAVVLAALPLAGAAAPYSVRLGLEKIVLDALPGFTDTTDLGSPRLQDLASALTSSSNRVLLFALTDTDLRRFTYGEPLDPKKRYMIVSTPKGLERERVSAELFTAFAGDSLRDVGKPMQVADAELVKFLESQPIGLANLLDELRREPTAVSVMQATRLQPLPGATMLDRNTPQYLLFTTTFVLVRGKALLLSVYTLFYGQADMDWLKLATRRWVDDLQRLNAR